jgi:hypothetical protein
MDTSRITRFGDNEKKMVQAGIDAVTGAEMWDWMKSYEPEEGKGFMYSDHPNLDKINSRMHKLYDGHSGSSYGWTMRQLEFIAKNGFTAYVNIMNGGPRPSRAATPVPEVPAVVPPITDVPPVHNRANTGGAMPRNLCMCRDRQGLTEGWCGVASGGVPACEY